VSKKILVFYLLSFFLCSLIIISSPPGQGGERPCACDHHQTYYDEWCTQWCGETNGICQGEVFQWGCWCRNPGYSWICDCGYIVICDDFTQGLYFSVGCDDTYCGWE